MQFRSAMGSAAVLLPAMIRAVYPVGHRNERRETSSIALIQIPPRRATRVAGTEPPSRRVFVHPSGLTAHSPAFD
jgi:hypothetical protein